MNRNKPKVGDKLFSLNVGNSARNFKQTLTPVIVKKVGRKYFYTVAENNHSYRDESYWTPYNIDTWEQKTEYSANSKLFKTEIEWDELVESRGLCGNFKHAFNYGSNSLSLSIETLRKINELIQEEINRND